MKAFPASALLLSLSLLGCSKETAAPAAQSTDPFVGQWKAEARREVEYSTGGQVVHDNTYTHAYRLSVTPTTFQESNYSDPGGTGTLNTEPEQKYTRKGESVTVEAWPTSTIQLQGLSDTGFTYVLTAQRVGNGPRVITIVYHR